MGAISSINFKKSNAIQARHNDRDLPPNYIVGGNCEVNHNHREALKLKNQIIQEAIEKYTERTGQRFQAKSYEWSAVCNIKDTTTMQELETLAAHFNKKYGFQCYQIAIHRDEGHINEQGQKVINHHAHLEFITLDKKTGKQCFKLRDFPPSKMREIQTEVAAILQMQRGQDKRISGAKRIEPRAYAKMKEAEKANTKELKRENESLQAELHLQKAQNAELKQELLNAKEIKAFIERFRKNSIGKGLPKEFYRDLSALKNNTEPTTKELLDSTLQDLFNNYQTQASKAKTMESQIKELKLKLQKLEQHKQELIEQLTAKERRIYEFVSILQDNLEPQEFIKLANICQDLEKESKLSDLSAENQKTIQNHTQTNKNDLRGISDDSKHKYIQRLKEHLKKIGITGLAAQVLAEFQYAQDTGADYSPPKAFLKLLEQKEQEKSSQKAKDLKQNQSFSRGR